MPGPVVLMGPRCVTAVLNNWNGSQREAAVDPRQRQFLMRSRSTYSMSGFLDGQGEILNSVVHEGSASL